MIISRYLTKEVTSALLATTFILLLVFMCNQIVRYLNYVASGKVGANVLLQLLGFEIPTLLSLLLPLGLYLGIIFSFGRLYAENELHVMHSSGLSDRTLVAIICFISLIVTLCVLILTIWVNPYIAAEKNKLITQSITVENLMNTIMPGRFQVLGSDTQRVVYIENVLRHHKEAHNLFFADQKMNKDNSITWDVLSADKGYQIVDHKNHDRFVVATDGYRYEGIPGQNNYKIIQFSKYAVRIPSMPKDFQSLSEEGMPTYLLIKNYHNAQNKAELQWRLSIPFSVFLLALLAIPLSKIKPRQGRFTHLFPAILIYIVYINLLFVARDWLQDKKSVDPIGMWWVHSILIVFIIVLFWLQSYPFSKNRKSLPV